MTVVVVGDVDEDARGASDFGGRSPIGAAASSAPVDGSRRRASAARSLVSVPMTNKSQADVAYGFIGIRRPDPDYMAASVMNNALGQYAIGGRLGDSIRERQGMAYYVFSSLDAGFGAGR